MNWTKWTKAKFPAVKDKSDDEIQTIIAAALVPRVTQQYLLSFAVFFPLLASTQAAAEKLDIGLFDGAPGWGVMILAAFIASCIQMQIEVITTKQRIARVINAS